MTTTAPAARRAGPMRALLVVATLGVAVAAFAYGRRAFTGSPRTRLLPGPHMEVEPGDVDFGSVARGSNSPPPR